MKLWVKQNPQASIHRKAMQRKKFRAMWDTEKSKDAKFGAAYEKKAVTMQYAKLKPKMKLLRP
jgi:hypothetical protein